MAATARQLQALHSRLLIISEPRDADSAQGTTASDEFPADPEGVRWAVPDTIGYLSTGFSSRFSSGRTFGVAGSAPHKEDLDHAVTGPADASPSQKTSSVSSRSLDVLFIAGMSPDGAPTQSMTLSTPRLTISRGDALVADAIGYEVGEAGYITRTVRLGPAYGSTPSVAILDPETLDVVTVEADGRTRELPSPVIDLDDVSDGRWEVLTAHSTHIIDLDRGLWTRVPGPRANPFPGLGERIRTFQSFRLGEHGFITLYADDFLIDYYWAATTCIRHIRRTNDDDD
ncbi:hypothetical protein [Agromyces sp. Leaf222]|uniref:hypothetical protein n=1 Tax=Agromyces sp. Leaf222 TaxID=1735688 RepID=UPI0012FAC968|nr:hypothetical protein [Agromyces sp. Leaf222]